MPYAYAVLPFVNCPVLPYFAPHLINGTIFRCGELLYIEYVLIFTTTFICKIYHSKKN